MGRKKGMGKGVSNQLEKQLKGHIPVYDPKHPRFDWDGQYIQATHWYDSFISPKDEKNLALSYMKKNPEKYNVKQIADLHERNFVYFGRYFEMLANNFGACSYEWLTDRIDSKYSVLLSKAMKTKDSQINIPKKNQLHNTPYENLVEKTLEKFSELLVHIDSFISNISTIKKSDDLQYFNAVSWANQNELGAKHIKVILDELAPEKNVYIEALDGDRELRSGYLFTDSQMKRIIRFYDQIMSDLSSLHAQKSVERKPRKKKQKTPIQLVKSVKYMQQTDEFGGLKSALPSKIIGSGLVILFNTKYRKISVYRTDHADGMSIKGTTILGFDTSLSFEKRIREKYLPDLIKAIDGQGIRAIKKMMDGIKAVESVPTGRINGDCIILKIK